MAARFRAAGFPAADIFVGGPHPRKGNLVVRYRGRAGAARKPILLLAHLDVVEAKKEDWSAGLDPFTFTEKDGYYYGRGTTDDKAMAAIFVANLLRMKRRASCPSATSSSRSPPTRKAATTTACSGCSRTTARSSTPSTA